MRRGGVLGCGAQPSTPRCRAAARAPRARLRDLLWIFSGARLAVGDSGVRGIAVCLRIRKETAIATAIHVRGCDIGADVSRLKAIQALLKPAVVSAPVCPMFYIPVRPNRPPSLGAWAKRYAPTGRRRIFEKAGQSPLLLDVDYQGAFTGAHSALDANGDLSAWADVFHETRSSSVITSFPVAGLWPNDASKGYVLAHESAAYAGLLAAVRM